MNEPKPDEYIGVNHARYNGRDFYGEHAYDLAELNYLRDWKRWAISVAMLAALKSVGALGE